MPSKFIIILGKEKKGTKRMEGKWKKICLRGNEDQCYFVQETT